MASHSSLALQPFSYLGGSFYVFVSWGSFPAVVAMGLCHLKCSFRTMLDNFLAHFPSVLLLNMR